MARAGERFIKRRQRSDVGEGVECVGCGRRKIDDISIQYPSRSLVATSRFQPFTRDTNIYIVNFQRRVYRISDRTYRKANLCTSNAPASIIKKKREERKNRNVIADH